jgi:hypothetical protein
VSQDGALDRDLWAAPAKAAAEWLTLREVLEAVGSVACETTDPEAWWPDAKDVDGTPARRARAACRACPAAGPCLAYALAADHRYGIWGGLLPDERRALRWSTSPEDVGRAPDG